MSEKRENQRRYFRHHFEIPLCASMRIATIDGRVVETKTAFICIHDIGAGGMKFQSHLKLPVNQSVIFNFSMKILEKLLDKQGEVLRCNKLENGAYEYGVNFVHTNENETQEMLVLISKMQIALRNKVGQNACSMCSQKTNCYKSNGKKEVEYGVF